MAVAGATADAILFAVKRNFEGKDPRTAASKGHFEDGTKPATVMEDTTDQNSTESSPKNASSERWPSDDDTQTFDGSSVTSSTESFQSTSNEKECARPRDSMEAEVRWSDFECLDEDFPPSLRATNGTASTASCMHSPPSYDSVPASQRSFVQDSGQQSEPVCRQEISMTDFTQRCENQCQQQKGMANFLQRCEQMAEDMEQAGARLSECGTFLHIVCTEPSLRRSSSEPTLLTWCGASTDVGAHVPDFEALVPSETADSCSTTTAGSVADTRTNAVEAHESGRCIPCNWQRRQKGCKLGDACGYCHLPHDTKRKRNHKSKRKTFLMSEEASEPFFTETSRDIKELC